MNRICLKCKISNFSLKKILQINLWYSILIIISWRLRVIFRMGILKISIKLIWISSRRMKENLKRVTLMKGISQSIGIRKILLGIQKAQAKVKARAEVEASQNKEETVNMETNSSIKKAIAQRNNNIQKVKNKIIFITFLNIKIEYYLQQKQPY